MVPAPTNRHTTHSALLRRRRPHSAAPLPSSWFTPLGPWPLGLLSSLPSGEAPASVSRSPWPRDSPRTARGRWTGRASGGPCPSSRPSGQSSRLLGPQMCCPAPRAVLPTGPAQGRGLRSLRDERSPTLQAGTLVLPPTEVSPLLGRPLPTHLPTLPPRRRERAPPPLLLSGHKSSSQEAQQAPPPQVVRRPPPALPLPTSGHSAALSRAQGRG